MTAPKERKAALTALLDDFLNNPARSAQELHDKSLDLVINPFDLIRILDQLDRTPTPDQLDKARWLVENATNQCPTVLGLGLLRGNAEKRDIPLLKTVGLRPFTDRLAADVLARIPDATDDLIWLADRARPSIRKTVAEQLIDHPDPAVRDWVRSTPRDLLSSEQARQIAERHDLVTLLNAPTVQDGLWDQAGNLLIAMNGTHNYHTEIERYPDAQTLYRRWVSLAASRPATLDRAALLTSTADDLATGPAALVIDSRAAELNRIKAVLSSPSWTEAVDRALRSTNPIDARRAAWIRDRIDRTDIPDTRFAIRIVVPDPTPTCSTDVEARILVDGRPLRFPNGPAESPEYLLASGRLRASNTPTDTRFAEAYCTEGCCGALRVTIVREGDEVVFRNWQTSSQDTPPRHIRFDAAQYDREVTRAEQDHGWEWPARTLARLVAGQIRADPAILGRWDCGFDWCVSSGREPDTMRLSFTHPAQRDSFEEPFTQFSINVDVQGREPATLAAELVTSMRETDPRTIATPFNQR